VAAAALEAGAALVNDVSGGLADPDMVPLVAAMGRPFVAMHWRGHSTQMQSRAVYGNVVGEVLDELSARRDDLLGAGIAPERLVLDPGLGFAKTAEHNWALMAALPALHGLGHPVLLGASRKTFLGRLGRGVDAPPRPAAERDLETTATSVMAAMAGLWCVRVHDVASTVRALAVVQAALDHAGDDLIEELD
jgi:dihydropteroate synthase